MKHRLPEFLGIGPPRTGTTWLHNVLEGHVDLPYGVKETLYFTTFYDKGFDWYARHFRYAAGERKVAEVCPYFFDTVTIERIKAIMPNCKFIVTMRDPVDRLYSMYKELRYAGMAGRGDFEQTLSVWPSMAKGNRYASHLKGWFDHFGRENVLVTMYDEMRSDPQQYLDRVTAFIGIDRIAISDRPRIRGDVNAYLRAPRNRKLARKAWQLKYWLKGRQAYGAVNLLERTGVWDFCAGRGELYQPLTFSRTRACVNATSRKSKPSRTCSGSISRPGRNRARRESSKVLLPKRCSDWPTDERERQTPPSRDHRRRSGPHRHHLVTSRARGRRRFALRRQGDAVLHTFYDKGIEWYAHHFRYATGDRKVAEICPYFFHPLAPGRIKTHIPIAASSPRYAILSITLFPRTSWSFTSRGRTDHSTRSWSRGQSRQRQSLRVASQDLVRAVRPRERAGHDV